MTILSIPDIVVLEAIHVDVEAIAVDIDVGNEELCVRPSQSLPVQS